MKHLLIITALSFLIGSITAQQTAFIFRVSETSVSVVEGSIGITYSFALFPDTLTLKKIILIHWTWNLLATSITIILLLLK